MTAPLRGPKLQVFKGDDMVRRWTINGRFLSQPTTGVQRYAQEVVRSLDSLIAEQVPLARGLEVELLCPSGSGDMPLVSIERREIGRAGGHVWEQTHLLRPLATAVCSACATQGRFLRASTSFAFMTRMSGTLHRAILSRSEHFTRLCCHASAGRQRRFRRFRTTRSANLSAAALSRRDGPLLPPTATSMRSGGNPSIRRRRDRPRRAIPS